MTTKQHSHYLKFLAKKYDLLLLSNNPFEAFEELKNDFNSFNQRSVENEELENLTSTLLIDGTDIVVLDFTNNYKIAKEMHNVISSYNDRIVIVGIVDEGNEKELLELISILDGIVTKKFSIQLLRDKLFTILSIFYTIKSVSRREHKIGMGSSELNTDLDAFFDTFEGSSLFIVDELVELNSSLKSGELSETLLQNIAGKFHEIYEMFSNNKTYSSSSEIFLDFSKYVTGIDISTIRPSSIHAFSYMVEIINDVNRILMDMFVDRIFNDTHVFEESLLNNIEFFKARLQEKKLDGSELDFFE